MERVIAALARKNIVCPLCQQTEFQVLDLIAWQWDQKPDRAEVSCKGCGYIMKFVTRLLLSEKNED